MPTQADQHTEQHDGLLLFARNFLKNPKMLGSVIPSSRYLVKRLLRPVRWEQARTIVEFGPGVGSITTHILRRMRSDATLVAIEMNPDFVSHLERTVADPRLRVVHGSAEDVEEILTSLGLGQADYIISGIPYSMIPPEVRARIVSSSRRVLRPGGALLIYQFTSAVLPDLQSEFGEVEQDFELLNILPARLFRCRV